MNAQEIFDTVVAHLFSMKEQSVDEYGYCSYRGKNGSKCAAGILIPDELYKPEMEKWLFVDVCIDFYLPEHLNTHMNLIEHLQSVHDTGLNWNDNGPNELMKIQLKTIAQKYNLNTNDIIETCEKEIIS